MMVDLLVVSKFKTGDDVIKEGSEGDSMYIVAGGDTLECPVVDIRGFYSNKYFLSFHFLAGELRVTQSGRDLRTLTTGDVFGELAILYNCKRTATVKGRPL